MDGRNRHTQGFVRKPTSPLSLLVLPAKSLPPQPKTRLRQGAAARMEDRPKSGVPQAPTPRRIVHASTSRPKPEPPGDEEATTVLKLGEFQNVDTLTMSEAALVLNALNTKRRQEHKNINNTEWVLFRSVARVNCSVRRLLTNFSPFFFSVLFR